MTARPHHCEHCGSDLSARTEDERAAAPRIVVDLSRNEARIDDQILELTARPAEMLHIFVSRPGQVLSRERLHNMIFGAFDEEADQKNVDVIISKLRKLLSDFDVQIHTYYGCGWGISVRDVWPDGVIRSSHASQYVRSGPGQSARAS